MSHLCRIVPRATTSVLYASRMQAHNYAPGTHVKVAEAKSGYHIVSGSGQFIATDGPSGSVSMGVGGGSSESMLPGAQSSSHHGGHGDHSKAGSDHGNQSFFSSAAGQFGLAAVGIGTIYGVYKLMADDSSKSSGRR